MTYHCDCGRFARKESCRTCSCGRVVCPVCVTEVQDDLGETHYLCGQCDDTGEAPGFARRASAREYRGDNPAFSLGVAYTD